MSDKNGIIALLLCIFIPIGLHRFYVGKIGTGILFLVTVGGFGIWTIIDLILVVMGKFKDKDGNALALKL